MGAGCAEAGGEMKKWIGLVWLVSVCARAEVPPPVVSAPNPNIIVFLADDMGMGDTSAYQDWCGNPDNAQLHTPAMTRPRQCRA